jgi:hypothetical protein
MRMLADSGLTQVADVLSAMYTAYGDPAFAPPPLLNDWVLAGSSPDGAARPVPGAPPQTGRR